MKFLLYDAVIFDLDGTLTDSQEGILNCVVYALEKMGRPVPHSDTLRKFLGPPLADSYMRYCGMDAPSAAEATRLYRERFLPIGWQENKVYPGVRALLKALKEAGVYLAVATGKPQAPSVKILEHFGLARYFDRIIGPEMGELHADKADLIRRALPDGPVRAVMIGDRDSDILGARARGIDSIAAYYGYGSREELDNARPTACADSVAALSCMLLGKAPQTKGYFITLEGLDGCGKSTQTDRLERALRDRGYDVVRTREPGGCPISEKIRELLLDVRNTGMRDITEALLYAAARAQHVREVILPAIGSGKIVLCERFVDSSVAFQGGGRQLGVPLIQQINAPAIAGCAPDATVYLRLDHQTALRRRKNASALDRIESEEAAFHARVEAAYELLCGQNPQRFMAIDASQTPDVVTDNLLSALFARMEKDGVA